MHSGTRVAYAAVMAERKIDREAWADLVATLINSKTRGKKAPFARLVGVDPRTVTRWIVRDVDVSVESVSEVARAVGRNPVEMLAQVGYYRPEEVNAPEPTPEQEDEEIRLIADSDLPAQRKSDMIERLLQMREEDRQRRQQAIRWMIDQSWSA